MCSPMMGVTLGMQAISGAMQAKGLYEQGKAEEQAYKHQAAVNEQNAKLAQVSADNAGAASPDGGKVSWTESVYPGKVTALSLPAETTSTLYRNGTVETVLNCA